MHRMVYGVNKRTILISTMRNFYAKLASFSLQYIKKQHLSNQNLQCIRYA